MLISNGLRLIFFCLLFLAQPISFHCFRHTFAMLLQEKGVEIYTISKLLAHKRVSSTQVYAKVTNQQVYEAIQLLK